MKIYKLNSGLETHLGCGLKTTKPCPPKLYVVERTSGSYKHKGEDRQKLTTSKDVMPVIAGYTSNPLVTKKSLHEVSDKFTILCMCKGTAAQIKYIGSKMPLPNIRNNYALQCHAKAKHTGNQCLNLAAYGGRVCRLHGARKPKSILRGAQHPNFKHGRETLDAKAKRSAGLARLRKIEDVIVEGSFYKLHRSKGRKPNGY